MAKKAKQGMSLPHHACTIGVFAVFFYIVCLLYGLTLQDEVLQAFHMASLKLWLPGFSGYTMPSLLWGAVLTFFYGFFLSLLFHIIHRDCECGMEK